MSKCIPCRLIAHPCEILLIVGWMPVWAGRWLARMMATQKPVYRPAGAYREIRLIDDRGELIAVERQAVGRIEAVRDVPMMIEAQKETARA